MSWQDILTNYGGDIILFLVNVVLYIVFFVLKKSVTNIGNKCVEKLTTKEKDISTENAKLLQEMETLRKENEELKARQQRIEQALIHISEVKEDGQIDTIE